jgi:glycerophosphoryl diester phosphodiesterase
MRWVVALGVVVSGIAALRGQDDRVLAPYTRPTLIAHRGASAYAPEHTIDAYRLALQQGADFVEPDLQVTKDAVLVCMHDTTLERTTNVRQVFPDRARETNGRKTWPVADFTLEEIQKLDAGSWRDAKFAGAKVPTFQQMIDLVRGKAGLIPETKAPEVYGRLGLNMEKLLMDLLARNGLEKPGADPKTPIIVQSFSAESLKVLRKDYGCRLPLVFLIGGGSQASQYASAEGLKKVKEFADGIGPNTAVVRGRPEMVRDAHQLGMSVTVWTVGSRQADQFENVRKEMAHLLRELRVDAVFTDNPDLFPRD